MIISKGLLEAGGAELHPADRGVHPVHPVLVQVPIYPRDILGESFRDEWRDYYARPLIATVEIPKEITHNVTNFKLMPQYMVKKDTQITQTPMERVMTMVSGGESYPVPKGSR